MPFVQASGGRHSLQCALCKEELTEQVEPLVSGELFLWVSPTNTPPLLHNGQGEEVRYCQRCGVAHPLSDYDGDRRSCRRQLERHNARR